MLHLEIVKTNDSELLLSCCPFHPALSEALSCLHSLKVGKWVDINSAITPVVLLKILTVLILGALTVAPKAVQ